MICEEEPQRYLRTLFWSDRLGFRKMIWNTHIYATLLDKELPGRVASLSGLPPSERFQYRCAQTAICWKIFGWFGSTSLPRKNFPLSFTPKSVAFSVLSRLDKRGGSRVVTNAGRDAVDARASGAMCVRRAVFREWTLAAQDERRWSVRQNRVVPTPVAGAKLCGGEISSTELDQPL